MITEIDLDYFLAGFPRSEINALLVYPAETEEQAKAIFTEVTDNLGTDVWKL